MTKPFFSANITAVVEHRVTDRLARERGSAEDRKDYSFPAPRSAAVALVEEEDEARQSGSTKR